MPEDFSTDRRKFLGYALGGVAGAITLGYAVPLVSYVVRPSLAREEEQWSKVGSLSELPEESPQTMNFTSHIKVGWQDKSVEHDVWVVKHAGEKVTVFSPTCPHLGCGYRWDPADRKFKCPCHGSVFDINGMVLAGPAPRGLDTLPSRVDDGVLYVKFEKFRLGVSDKVEA